MALEIGQLAGRLASRAANLSLRKRVKRVPLKQEQQLTSKIVKLYHPNSYLLYKLQYERCPSILMLIILLKECVYFENRRLRLESIQQNLTISM